MNDERRARILTLDADVLLTLLTQWQWTDLLPPMDGLPADAHATQVHADWSRRSVDFLIESRQFAPVPLGEEPPRLHLYIEQHTMEPTPNTVHRVIDRISVRLLP